MADDIALRLLLYDRTCTGGRLPLGLTHSWLVGKYLYAGLGRIDMAMGVASWDEALTWLGEVKPERPISEIQYWGHGNWGKIKVDGEPLTREALAPGHALRPKIERVRERLTIDALVWWRTCDAFGAREGQSFAQAWSDFLGCDVAGHTFIIGIWQSGLHRISPGKAPHWSDTEGLLRGTPEAPEKAAWSTPMKPYTINFLSGGVPEGW